MPKATVTLRELKNKTTGVDLTIPTYKETPGMLGKTVMFHVVVVSNLPHFKSPQHKGSDVVQFMVERKFSDFEMLRKNMVARQPTAALPPLPSSGLFSGIVDTSKSAEVKPGLEHFLKFVAVTPKLATCHMLLEFLGVNSVTAGKFRAGESKEGRRKKPGMDIFEEQRGQEKEDADDALFGGGGDAEDEEQEDDILAAAAEAEPRGDTPFRGDAQPGLEQSGKLFDDQDLGGEIDDFDDDQLFFVPGAKVTKKVVITTTVEEQDLLNVDDDLDDLYITKAPSGTRAVSDEGPPVKEKPSVSPKPPVVSACIGKPQISPKPQPPPMTKPQPSAAARPEKPPKPKHKPTSSVTKGSVPGSKAATSSAAVDFESSLLSPNEGEMSEAEARGTGSGNLFGSKVEEEVGDSDLFQPSDDKFQYGADDILKYIEQNTEDSNTDLDLFS